MIGKNAFIGRAAWDGETGAWTDGPARYLMLRADTLMGLFERLAPEARTAALAALVAATAEAGGESLRRYRDQSGLDAAGLAAAVERTAAELGWGRVTLSLDGENIEMAVRNSPFAAAAAPSREPVCAPLTGILSAFAASVRDRPAVAREVACAATGDECCRFAVEQ